jgi:hypothetical protein
MAYNSHVAEMIRRAPILDASPQDDDAPSLDPLAIERAYRRERARRRARVEHRSEMRRSNLRFWALLLGTSFAAVFLFLLSWQLVQSLFGI